MAQTWFAPKPEDLLRREAASWKARALAAEGKLSGYRRLREVGERVLSAALDRNRDARVVAIDELGDELAMLDVVDSPAPLFEREIDLGNGSTLTVEESSEIESCATLDLDARKIRVNRRQPFETKVVGLVWQLLQLAELADKVARGDTQERVDGERLTRIVPTFLAFMAAAGLLRQDMPLTPASLESAISELRERPGDRA